MATATKNCITLKGSAQIISEYLKFGINAILFQRGIYPPETFDPKQQYGLTIYMSTDAKIKTFLEDILKQTEEWLGKNMVHKVCMIITNAHSKEVLECWDFQMQPLEGDGGEPSQDFSKSTSSKDLQRIQSEIRDVMRQISATVSYLPLLDVICTFDIMIHTYRHADIPEKWNETSAAVIQNPQQVELRSFSTGLHKVDTVVNYKLNP